MEKAKQVGIWIRVSTEDQAKGESPEHHEKRARLYAESKGWHVKEVYHLEAVSGKSVMGRPETQQMLEDIQTGRISGLIFSKLARLARNTKGASGIFRHLQSVWCRPCLPSGSHRYVHSCRQAFLYDDCGHGPMGAGRDCQPSGGICSNSREAGKAPGRSMCFRLSMGE